MKKIKCLINVPDKYTGKEYKAGEVYEFEDARADEILACRTRVTGEPFFVEEVENEETNEDVENVENPVENIEEAEPVVLEDMKVAELKELATKMNIENADKMKKDELIEAIKNHG